MDRDEAEALVKLIEATHGLSPRIRSGDEPDSWEVDVDVPPTGAALRETITVSDRDDWDWLWEAYQERSRGGRDG